MLSPKSNLVFVSGASKGIGRSTALAFAQASVAGLAIAARSDLSSLESDFTRLQKMQESESRRCFL